MKETGRRAYLTYREFFLSDAKPQESEGVPQFLGEPVDENQMAKLIWCARIGMDPNTGKMIPKLGADGQPLKKEKNG